MKIETAVQLAEACHAAAGKKTLYVFGAFGSPLTEENKQRILKGYAYNRRETRRKKILSATDDTFGFDCSGLIKGLLWEWNGDGEERYGGAVYGSNGVKDQNADTIISCCAEVSEDFTDIQVGEAVWLPGHIGIYIGDGLAVEASPKWADGVQITACNCKKDGYHARTWRKHGKLPYISYDRPVTVTLRELRRGSQGDQVKALQRMLVTMGFPIGTQNPIDGSFGPKTEAAVRTYQQENGLRVSGRVEETTWKALLGV